MKSQNNEIHLQSLSMFGTCLIRQFYLAVPYPNRMNKVVNRLLGFRSPRLTCGLPSVIKFRAARAVMLRCKGLLSNRGFKKFVKLEELGDALGCGCKTGHGTDVAQWGRRVT
jgi:hypothetical protein